MRGSARSEPEFFAALKAAELLVRIRPGASRPNEAAEYAVSLPGLADWAGQQVWYGGQTVSGQLGLRALHHRWRAGRPGTTFARVFAGAKVCEISVMPQRLLRYGLDDSAGADGASAGG